METITTSTLETLDNIIKPIAHINREYQIDKMIVSTVKIGINIGTMLLPAIKEVATIYSYYKLVRLII
jgi:hypothetical protein